MERDYVAATGIKLVTVDAADRFLDALAGVTEPETKRKIIGREFIRVFESAAADIVAAGEREPGAGSGSWCRARCTPMSSSPAAAPGRRRSSRTTMSAGCQTT